MHPHFRPPDIGLIGRARVGKSTAAEMLARKWGHVPMGFADPVREGLEALNPIVAYYLPGEIRYRTAVHIYGYEATKDLYPEARRLLQEYGTGLRAALGPDVWVDALARRIEALPPSRPVVVTDVRFPNEAEHLRELGFVLVRVTRAAASSAGDHVSETALDAYPADFTFANDGTPDALEAYLDGLVFEHSRPA